MKKNLNEVSFKSKELGFNKRNRPPANTYIYIYIKGLTIQKSDKEIKKRCSSSN